MNQHDESATWAIAIAAVLVTLIISATMYEINESNLKAKPVPQELSE